MAKLLKQTQIAELAAMDNPLSKLQNAFNWTVEIQPDPKKESITLLVWDSMTWRRFLQSYYDWSYTWVDVNDNDYYKAFIEIVEDFKRNHLDGLKRVLTAFYTDYAPLENYDKNVDETVKNEFGHQISNNTKGTEQTTGNTHGGGTTTNNLTTDTKVSTYDANVKDVSYVTNGGTITINSSADVTNNTTTTGSDSEIHSGEDKMTREYHEHGNIGVTTAQQMLQAEYDLRMKQNFEDDLLSRFAFECLVLIP